MMKKVSVLLLSLVLVVGLATVSVAGIVGTKHDLSSSGSGATLSTQICNVCHTPHNALSATNAPLWNHTITTATFTPYSGGGTLDATVGAPSGVSLLCLSCHDGTVALDAFQGNTPTTTITGNALLDVDLSNDHPISFTYDAALVSADGGLNDPTAAPISGWLFGASNDQLECASCHDVHDDTNSPFLRVSNANSALCLTCHNK